MATGVDFSGAARPDRKIWVATVAPAAGDRLTLDFLDNGFSYVRLVEKLLSLPSGPILMDFPFGLSAASAANLGVPPSASPVSMWQAVAACSTPSNFRDLARGHHSGPGSEAAHKRLIDRRCSTPFAPVNLRLARQTFFGMSQVLLPLAAGGLPIRPWSATRRSTWAGEGCPSSTLRACGILPQGYKGRPASAAATRKAIVDFLQSSGLSLPDSARERIVSDGEGDALDAVILAVAATRLTPAQLPAGRAWVKQHPTEGFVYV